MNSKKPIIIVVTLFLALGVFAFTIPVAFAHPKSLYLIADHHTGQFDAWNIEADGTATYQATHWLSYVADPSGIAIDIELNPDGTLKSATLFVTAEFDYGVELVDAVTMTSLGYVDKRPDGTYLPDDLAGIDVDYENSIVYAVERWTNNLYAFDWDRATKTLTSISGFDPYNLPGVSGAFGIALDEKTDTLWVADAVAPGAARAFDTTTWTEDLSKSFTPAHQPVDIAVDRERGFVYTVSMTAGAWTPAGTGSILLSKYDLATGIETTGTLADQGVGVAVDEVDPGLVYVTLSPYGRGLLQGDLQVWDTSTSPWTLVDSDKTAGSPAGICIPKEEVVYNPLSLKKDDGLAGQCVNPGDTITYTLSFNNTNPYTVNNVVLWDDLSPDVTFVTATGGGGGYPWSYDPVTHTVTWDIGDLDPASPDSVTLTVTVNMGAVPGSKITNRATIQPIDILGGATTVVEETDVCPGFIIPEVPLGTIMASVSMIIALVAYIALPRFRRRTN